MVFQEAQARFSAIVQSIVPGMSSSQTLAKQNELRVLLESLPNTAEFDPIASAIAELSPKLTGVVSTAVLNELRSRDNAFKETSTLLAHVTQKANADARALRFEQPKLVVAALTEAVTTLKEVQSAADEGKFHEVASKAEALVALIEQVKATVKAT